MRCKWCELGSPSETPERCPGDVRRWPCALCAAALKSAPGEPCCPRLQHVRGGEQDLSVFAFFHLAGKHRSSG